MAAAGAGAGAGAGAPAVAVDAKASAPAGPWYRVQLVAAADPKAVARVWTATASSSAVVIEYAPAAVAGAATPVAQAWRYDAKEQALSCAAYPARVLSAHQHPSGVTAAFLTAAGTSALASKWQRLVVQLGAAGSVVKFVSAEDADMALDTDAGGPAPQSHTLWLRKQKHKARTQEFVLIPIAGELAGAAVESAAAASAAASARVPVGSAGVSALAAGKHALMCPYYARALAAAKRNAPNPRAPDPSVAQLLFADADARLSASERAAFAAAAADCSAPFADASAWAGHVQAAVHAPVHLRFADFAHVQLQKQVDQMQELLQTVLMALPAADLSASN